MKDNTKKRIFNNLMKIASSRDSRNNFNPFVNKIMFHNGSFYASDGYVLMKVQFSEYDRLKEPCDVYEVEAWEDKAGNFIEPKLRLSDKYSTSIDTLDKLLIMKNYYEHDIPFNAKLLKRALDVFAIADVHAMIQTDDHMCKFQGRNSEIRIECVVMGVRK